MRRARLNLKEPLLICDLPGTSNNKTKLTTTIVVLSCQFARSALFSRKVEETFALFPLVFRTCGILRPQGIFSFTVSEEIKLRNSEILYEIVLNTTRTSENHELFSFSISKSPLHFVSFL